ncbi:MAG TPA: replication-associated recombination protein A [Campylobacterales bacterium]|nr:replication-associated recombination protein A [Campylobacterales bacterium]
MENFASIFRPLSLDEVIGQKHLVSPHTPFYKLLKQKSMPHCFFYGPAGCGKTTVAKIVSQQLDSTFYSLDATSIKVEEMRKILQTHRNSLIKPVIFIDEVHRLSRNQQEVLLLPMERNDAVIIGASTENPYFTLTSAIRSRSMLFEFKPIEKEDFNSLFQRVEKKLGITIHDEAREYLINSSSGDVRAMLNLLEFGYKVDSTLSIKTLKSLRPNALKDGVSSSDTHYQLASALIKSLRGSDVDASIYYLARLIDGGESADFIARRLVIFASEDIGNANPNALNLAASTQSAVLNIGYPEARIILSQCVIYLASSPKSNSSYKAINKAIQYLHDNPDLKIPEHLKSPLNKGYKYPHDFGGFVKQSYLEYDLKFYESLEIGFEKTLSEWVKKIRS